MLVYQRTMFDRYYCIKSFCHLKNFGKNTLKSYFLYYYSGLQKHEAFIGFENACARAATYLILKSRLRLFLCRLLFMRSNCSTAQMRICKVQKPCINSR